MAELDGTVYHRPTAQFRVIPYFPRSALPLPNLDSFLDVDADRLAEMESSIEPDPEADDVEVDVSFSEEED